MKNKVKAAIRNPQSPIQGVSYTKLSGTGNDFVLVDTLHTQTGRAHVSWPRIAQRLCNRSQGIGADGLLVLGRSRVADVRMRIFNPDGSEPDMCGNGLRCLAWYATRSGQAREGGTLTIQTKAGIKQATFDSPNHVRVDLGVPRFIRHFHRFVVEGRRVFHMDVVNSGVFHVVCWVSDVSRIDVRKLGRYLRNHPRFRPQGANVDFVEWVSMTQPARPFGNERPYRIRLKMRTYERGVEAETRACGTGAVASAAAAIHHALSRETQRTSSDMHRPFAVEVSVPGGVLRVNLEAKSHCLRQKQKWNLGHAWLEGKITRLDRGVFTFANGRE